MLNPTIITRLSEKSNLTFRYSSDCECLSNEIKSITGKILGTTTIKRMLGFTSEQAQPRLSTLDIIAEYLGYKNYDEMRQALVPAQKIESINKAQLKVGDAIRVMFIPGKTIVLGYIGNKHYVVSECNSSKLIVGDIVAIEDISMEIPFVCSQVYRKGSRLNDVHVADRLGIKSLEIISSL